MTRYRLTGAIIKDMEEDIRKLKNLISDYEEERDELSAMVSRWEDHDDPGSDPGLQYEQENRVAKAYNRVVEYAKKLETRN